MFSVHWLRSQGWVSAAYAVNLISGSTVRRPERKSTISVKWGESACSASFSVKFRSSSKSALTESNGY